MNNIEEMNFLTNKSYRSISKIGEGAFGEVVKAIDLTTNSLVAVKLLVKKKHSTSIYNEILILEKLQGTSMILKLIDSFESNTMHYIVTELCHATLEKTVLENPFYLPEEDTKIIIRKVSECIAHIHDLGIVHRDIKAENIMIVKSNIIWDIRLIDFGMAAFIENGPIFEICGTPLYEAPEIKQSKAYGKSCDIWSIGVLTLLLATKFDDELSSEIMNTVSTGQYGKLWNSYVGIEGENYKDFIRMVLQVDPLNRIHSTQIARHPWLSRIGEPSSPMNLMKGFKIQDLWRKAIVFGTVIARFNLICKKEHLAIEKTAENLSLPRNKSNLSVLDLKIKTDDLKRSRTSIMQ